MSLRTDTPAPPFKRILIANRGEIAVRIMQTCRDLGVETVAVYSDADASALHVRIADVAVRIGPAPATDSYLRADVIIAAALSTGAQAIHPGYGFLSERSAFAREVIQAGLVFIGPSPEAIDALGDKLTARRTVSAEDVPVVPGTFDPAPVDRPDDVASLVEAALRIGFPLMVKASAGGGGRGMRRVASADGLPAALAAASAEAASAFGDGSVYLEREVHPARHIEVQLLGDTHGDLVALGERDCSIQRRHQKLVEESPAPDLTTDERLQLHTMAVRAGRAAGLHNAATAEFLFDEERRFWFLEVNARLQVEHGVTELVTDLDIVAEQLWIAAGRPLSPRVRAAAAAASAPGRHALEVRVYAEDPSRSFGPSAGRVTAWSMPAGVGVRVDTAIRVGDRVSTDYDPMIAKVMTVAADRGLAIARMRRALDDVEVAGIQTTLPFGQALVRDPGFVSASKLSVGWVAEHWDGDARRAEVARMAAAIAAGAVIAADAEDGTAGQVCNARESGEPGSNRSSTSPDSGLSVRKDTGRFDLDPGNDGSRWRHAGRNVATDRWPR
ncbi:MAG: biotin carboxylase N-terminal domain-containing protein [Candidatus Limnocylindrales bacterium]